MNWVVVVLCLLCGILFGCSNSKNGQQHAEPKQISAELDDSSSSEISLSDSDSDVGETPNSVPEVTGPVQPQELDYIIVPILTELRNQLKSDPYESANAIKNVQFANRILEVRFSYGKTSELKVITHTKKGISFVQVSPRSEHGLGTQYFESYIKDSNFYGLTPKGDQVLTYTAEAKTTQTKNKTVSVIKINDVETGASIYVLYAHKMGSLGYTLSKGIDYSKELTPTSRVFLERLLENPKAEAKFYTILTREQNVSNAYRFNISVSDTFTMETFPLFKHYSPSQPSVVPLRLKYKSFFRTMFFGSTAYSAIGEPTYIIHTDRNPVELKTLDIAMTLDAHEIKKGKRHSVPITLRFRF